MNYGSVFTCIVFVSYLCLANGLFLNLDIRTLLEVAITCLIFIVWQRIMSVVELLKIAIAMSEALVILQKRLTELNRVFLKYQKRRRTTCESPLRVPEDH